MTDLAIQARQRFGRVAKVGAPDQAPPADHRVVAYVDGLPVYLPRDYRRPKPRSAGGRK